MKLTRALIQEIEKPFTDDIPMTPGEAILELHEAGVDLTTQEKPQLTTIIKAMRYGLWLLQHVEDETVKEARQSQTMFYFYGDTYGIAEKGIEKSHLRWVQDQGKAGYYTYMILGYFDATELHLFTHRYEKLTPMQLVEYAGKCRHLYEDCNLSPELLVFNGDEKIGSLKELLQL